MTSRRWASHTFAVVPSPEAAESTRRKHTDAHPRTIIGSTHAVCLCSDAQGHTTARAEWELVFSRDTERIEAGARLRSQERIRFRADASQLRMVALAMLASARELEAIDAHMASSDRNTGIDPGYLETITLTEHGVGSCCDSASYVESDS